MRKASEHGLRTSRGRGFWPGLGPRIGAARHSGGRVQRHLDPRRDADPGHTRPPRTRRLWGPAIFPCRTVAVDLAPGRRTRFSPICSFAHPLAFQLASRLAELAPGDLDHAFGLPIRVWEACETALKIVIAYWQQSLTGLRASG